MLMKPFVRLVPCFTAERQHVEEDQYTGIEQTNVRYNIMCDICRNVISKPQSVLIIPVRIAFSGIINQFQVLLIIWCIKVILM